MNYFQKKLKQIEAAKAQQQDQGPKGALGGEMGGSFSEAQATGGMGQSFAQGGAAGENMGQGFSEQTKAYSRTQQGDDPNRQVMRDDYGWKMTERQYKTLQKDKSAFERQLRDYKTEYNQRIAESKAKGQAQIAAEETRYGKFKEQFASEYAKNKGSFEKARGELSKVKEKLGGMPTQDSLFNKFWKDRKMRVTVWDGQKEQGSYYIPRDFVNELHKQVEGSYTGKGTYRVNVHQGGRMRGQEMHDMLRKDFEKNKVKQEFFADKQYQGKYRDAVKQWDVANRDLQRAQGNLSQQQAAWQQTVNKDRNALTTFNYNINKSRQQLERSAKIAGIERDTAVGKAQNQRQGQIDAARGAYEQRASSTNLANMTGSAKAKDTQGQTKGGQ